MTKQEIGQEVYRYPSNEYWGAPEHTRKRMIDLLSNLSPTVLAMIEEEDVRPTSNECMELMIYHGTMDLTVMIGYSTASLLLWDSSKNDIQDSVVKDSLLPTDNVEWEMPQLAHQVNQIVQRFFV